MPVLNIHLVSGQHSPEKVEELLLACSHAFAEGLNCPVDRTRVFVTDHAPRQFCLGGKMVSDSGEQTAYFSFIVLEGRPLEDRQKLLGKFTDLIVDILGVPRAVVRGGIVPVAPENWAISGVPASVTRQAEIAARAAAGGVA